jgi:hypothetical protein
VLVPFDGDLRRTVENALRDGMCTFSGFVATVERIDRYPRDNAAIHLKSFANAEATYIMKIVPAELVKDGRPLASGDKVVFSGRYEGATVKAATQDFPEIRGCVTGVARAN